MYKQWNGCAERRSQEVGESWDLNVLDGCQQNWFSIILNRSQWSELIGKYHKVISLVLFTNHICAILNRFFLFVVVISLFGQNEFGEHTIETQKFQEKLIFSVNRHEMLQIILNYSRQKLCQRLKFYPEYQFQCKK